MPTASAPRRDAALGMQVSGATGWYYRVLEPGAIAEGDRFLLAGRPCPGWPLARLVRALFPPDLAAAGLFDEWALAATLEALAPNWKAAFTRRPTAHMRTRRDIVQFAGSIIAATLAATALAAQAHSGGIATAASRAVNPAFDIVHTKITTDGNVATFHVAVSGKAGASHPGKTGKLAGSRIFSDVWPTTIDPSVVGFDKGAGILAFAVTVHPDFDDTPLYDENGDGDLANDGDLWHAHWVVLQPDDACGKGALKIVDIPAGARPKLPKTWPGLPILVDSPAYGPVFKGGTLEVRVPFEDIGVVNAAGFDGVTAALRINESVYNPLVCVVDVFKVASGKLTLPGKANR